jgi:predicted phosphoribosyltransferase
MEPTCLFVDRADAGRQLAGRLDVFRGESPFVVAVAPGGAPVAYEVAVALGAPLEAWLVRPLGSGDAIAENGCYRSDVGPDVADALDRSVRRVRRHARASMRNRTVILVDDGLAGDAELLAAIHAIRQDKPHRLVLAVPRADAASLGRLSKFADHVVCTPGGPGAALYREPPPAVNEDAVAELLDRRRLEIGASRPADASPASRIG